MFLKGFVENEGFLVSNKGHRFYSSLILSPPRFLLNLFSTQCTSLFIAPKHPFVYKVPGKTELFLESLGGII